jgi:hypothetical protein
MTPVHTVWHRIRAALAARRVLVPTGPEDYAWCSHVRGWNWPALDALVAVYDAVPHYFLDDRVISLMFDHPQQLCALVDMARCGVLHLPFPRVVVEYRIERIHYVVCLEESPGAERPWLGHLLTLSAHASGDVLQTLPYSVEISRPEEDDGPTFHSQYRVVSYAPRSLATTGGEDFLHELCTQSSKDVGLGLWILILALATRGVERAPLPAPAALNRSRVRRGEVPVPAVTRISLGAFYDRSGRRSPTTGRHVAMHWRAGHASHRWTGSRSAPAERTLKPVWIEPCLVNYDPELPAPAPRPREVAP